MRKTALPLLLAAAGAAAQAHVGLEPSEVVAGAAVRALLRIGHGCEGSPTHTVSVELPPGFRGAKPMPKPGWVIEIRRERLAQPSVSHGRTVTDDVVEVTRRAASREAWLDDAHFDEFVLRGQAPAQPGTHAFKVRQRCERGQWDWVETPAAGTASRAPAPLLRVRPADGSGR